MFKEQILYNMASLVIYFRNILIVSLYLRIALNDYFYNVLMRYIQSQL